MYLFRFTLGEILRICDESGAFLACEQQTHFRSALLSLARAFSYQNRFAVYTQMRKSEIKTSQFCHVSGDSESGI